MRDNERDREKVREFWTESVCKREIECEREINERERERERILLDVRAVSLLELASEENTLFVFSLRDHFTKLWSNILNAYYYTTYIPRHGHFQDRPTHPPHPLPPPALFLNCEKKIKQDYNHLT